jgi:hypothetical protein
VNSWKAQLDAAYGHVRPNGEHSGRQHSPVMLARPFRSIALRARTTGRAISMGVSVIYSSQVFAAATAMEHRGGRYPSSTWMATTRRRRRSLPHQQPVPIASTEHGRAGETLAGTRTFDPLP